MRNLELCTDIAEVLSGNLEKLKALTYLFSEQYTTIRLTEIPEAIQRNPDAFAVSFSVIEEMISNISEIASTLVEELFNEKRAKAG